MINVSIKGGAICQHRKRQIHHTFNEFTHHETIMKMNFIGGFL